MLFAALLVLGTLIVPHVATPECGRAAAACLNLVQADRARGHNHDRGPADPSGPEHAHEALTPRDRAPRTTPAQAARLTWAAAEGLPPAPQGRMERPPRAMA
jgi:hypothetical protein